MLTAETYHNTPFNPDAPHPELIPRDFREYLKRDDASLDIKVLQHYILNRLHMARTILSDIRDAATENPNYEPLRADIHELESELEDVFTILLKILDKAKEQK